MLGSETLEYDDALQQEEARRRKWETVKEVFSGGDPFAAAYDYAHYQQQAGHRTKQARLLMAPDEVLAMGPTLCCYFNRHGCRVFPIMKDLEDSMMQRSSLRIGPHEI